MDTNVSIIILNWNGWKDTIECLESLYQINYPNYDVIVVDNASKDESIEKIREYCEGQIKVNTNFFKYQRDNKPITIFEPIKNELENTEKLRKDYEDLPSNKKLILIKNDKNYGFAEGNNIGMRYALNVLNPHYILLLNNDTVVDREFLSELIEIAKKDKKIGFTGPKIYFYDFKGRRDVIDFAGGSFNFWLGKPRHIGQYEVDNGQYDEVREISHVDGSCMLVKTKMIEKIGLLNPSYFTYWEENDWCIRGYNAGYSSFYVPKAIIWHKISASSTSLAKIYYWFRNQFFFMRQHASKLQIFTFLLYFFVFYFWFKTGTFIVYHRDLKSFKCLLKGVKDGINMA